MAGTSVRCKGRAPTGYSVRPTASEATFVQLRSERPFSLRAALSWAHDGLLLFVIDILDYSIFDG